MLKHKAFKFRLYPNKEQQILIGKTIGCSRFVVQLPPGCVAGPLRNYRFRIVL